MPHNEKNRRLESISLMHAGAGTGKTFRLTNELIDLITCSSAERIRPDQFIATTFTNKASDELLSRFQSGLVEQGHYDLAQLIRGSYIGTVNSICGRLVSEFALEGGLSPSVDVLDEYRQRQVFFACAETPFRALADRLNELAYRLSIEDWRDDVLSIAELARQNGILGDRLSKTAVQSRERLNRLLPEAYSEEQAKVLEQDLKVALFSTHERLTDSQDKTKITIEACEFLNRCVSTINRGKHLPWSYWAQITKLRAANKSQDILAKLKSIASQYVNHPRLKRDWGEMIESVVSCAHLCIESYTSFKAEHGLIDFVDQEMLARSLLSTGLISDHLSERAKFILVDEFQDTSPIQLSIFLQLACSARSSLWVGDLKQSIFGFRGADPALMQSVSRELIELHGGSSSHLNTNYRSRPELVSFVNSLFSKCMPTIGIPEKAVLIANVARQPSPSLHPPLHFWWLNGKTFQDSLLSLPTGLLSILDQSEPSYLVHDRKTGQLRNMIGSDIAILCRSNEHRLRIASTLASAGFQIATERLDLLSTPECRLAVASLRFLADPYDTLAAGTIVRFCCEGTEWLSDWLRLGFVEFAGTIPILSNLNHLRARLVNLTPLEALDLAIFGSGILETVKGLGNFRQRSLSLDALRGLVRGYEKDCVVVGQVASVASLVAYLEEDPMEAKQPASPDENSINVLTYHGAKGLEWPVVILFDLDRARAGTAFGARVESTCEPDLSNPLKDRTLRYWPWPYGRQKANVQLGEICLSDEYVNASASAFAESTRLLYVGITRARDYLIFAARPTVDGVDWLRELKDSDGQPILSIPSNPGRHEMLRGQKDVHSVQTITLNPIDKCSIVDAPPSRTTPAIERSSEPMAYRLTPSKMTYSEDVLPNLAIVTDQIFLGGRTIHAPGDEIQLIGDVVHSFLTADDRDLPMTERRQLATDMLFRWKVSSVKAFDLISMSNRLQNALDKKFPRANRLTECPVYGFRGLQRIRGSIDLILLTADGYIVIDHKCYPGPTSLVEEKALSHAPQLFAYKAIIESAGSTPVIGCYIHLPLLGRLLSIAAT